MSETELKFLIAEADLPKLEKLADLREGMKDARAQQSRTIYFDTDRRDLWKRGFILRIRSVGGRLIQTIKQEQASLVERGEWEREIKPPLASAPLRPDLAMIEETPLAEAIDKSIRNSLRPAFEIDVERTTFLWRDGETLIEVVIDRGAIHEVAARGQTLRISELELELKQGDISAAFALARTLAAQAPLRLSLISKAERGQRLMARAIALPAKAAPPHLNGDMTIASAFMATAHACLHDFMLNVDALEGADPIEAVHQGRVALRRLRAALALFRPVRREGYARMNASLKWLADIFGAARDRDILSVGAIEPALGHVDATDFAQWREARRLAAHKAVRSAVRSKRWRVFLVDFCKWLEDAARAPASPDEGEDAMIRFARKRLKRRRKALVAAPQDLASLDMDALHKLRIRAKKLRYMAQFFADVPGVADPKQLKRLLDRLDELQSTLGDMRDEAARRGGETELRLWRSETGHADAAPPAAPAFLAAPIEVDGKNLGKAMKAFAELVRIDPF
jgi:inorganic triphosphatase YgiF